MTEPTQTELEAAGCWEADDHVPRRPETTAFRRRIRYDQAVWRERHGHPSGTQPYVPVPGKPVRSVGSRLPLDYARETGANFVTPDALAAVRERIALVEPHQSFDHQRLWADLLSSAAMAFNLFGGLTTDLAAADRLIRWWFPDAPGRVSDVRFVHSPGRFDEAYMNSLRDFLVAFLLDLDDGSRGVVAVDVKFHERSKTELPKPEKLARYQEVARRSGAFDDATIDLLGGRTEFCVNWLEHLLMFSMLQHASGSWTWGRYVVVHPVQNPDMTELVAGYRRLLQGDSTFTAATFGELLGSGALPDATTSSLRERYGTLA